MCMACLPQRSSDGGHLPYTRGYAPRAPQAPATSFGVAPTQRLATAGSPAHAYKAPIANRSYAVPAGMIPSGNLGKAAWVPAGARAVSLGHRKQNSKKAKQKKTKLRPVEE